MPLQKQPVNINFAQGLDQKSDPFQLPIGKFQALQNSVFNKAGGLTKRNGFGLVTTLPNTLQTTLTTLNDNLLATGSNLYAYSQDTNQWGNQGTIQPVSLETLPLIRVSTSQTSPDAATASGLTCLAYVDNSVAYYQVSDAVTGQQIVSRQSLGSNSNIPRVFILGQYFVVTFIRTIAGTPTLQYVAMPILMPSSPTVATTLDSVVVSNSTGYDGVVANNNLYVSWAASGTTIKIKLLNSTLQQSSAVTISGHTADLISLSADVAGSTPVIWVSFWDAGTTNGFTSAWDLNITPVLAVTQIVTGAVLDRLTSYANNQVMTLFYETNNFYGYDGSLQSDFVSKRTITQAGSLGTASVVLRSVGIASKPFVLNSTIYMLAAFGDTNTNQPTYFLIDSSGNIYLRLAATNGGGYPATQVVPSVTLYDGSYTVPYTIKDFLASVNKTTPTPAGNVSSIYTQTGVNLAKLQINQVQYTAEIADALHLTGGQLWEYDGVKPVEHGFQVYPENIEVTTATGAGSLAAGTYYYQFVYEWTDNAGKLHRSSPSLPVSQVTTTASSTNTVKVPTLRLTYKTSPNPVRIVGYRWSVAQQVYYQFTSLTAPTLNDTTSDFVTITDTKSDSQILGQTLLYTTGGVVENIAAPASVASCLFKNRLILIDAEDRNLLWYSKQVIEAVPVEMSDLFTIYIAPTTGAQGSTGAASALSAMDDKLIIFKSDAIYYITGSGPDITGSNNDFSDPIYVTSSVGCTNPNSIVLMPEGIMFQSDKGIWLLGRDMSTSYIGSPVEDYTLTVVKSAAVIPGTNQVRFILDSGITLMYDYYFKQWGTFSTLSAITSTLYQAKHTYLNTYGQVFQETPGAYLDGSTPVVLSFTTSWINIAGLQGYERFYYLNLLGTYFTPFKLNVQIAYNYATNARQSVTVTPTNYTPNWGGDSVWGASTPWGGTSNVFSARVFPEQQKCQSFQLQISEIYDPSIGVASGQGLSLSGLLVTAGIKKGARTQSAAKSYG